MVPWYMAAGDYLIVAAGLFCCIYTLLGNPGINDEVFRALLYKKEGRTLPRSNNMCSKCNIPRRRGIDQHCMLCGMCMVEIDHHCVFFGKCIAKGNIWTFRGSIGILCVSMFYYMMLEMLNTKWLTQEMHAAHQSSLI